MRRKPAPKSVQQSRIISNFGDLGETSGSADTDDENPDNHQVPAASVSRSNKSRPVNPSEFHSPDVDDDATDYGLEFTSISIANRSPRRCSTFKSSEKEQQQSGGDRNIRQSLRSRAAENNTHPSTSAATRTKKNQLPEAVNKQQAIRTTERPQEMTTSDAATPQTRKTVRKRRNPMQLERRFWKEVEALQNRRGNLIPLLPFSRLVRDIMQEASTEVTRITKTALEALQASSELYITQRMQDAYMLTLHRGRVTLDVRDMELIKYLKWDL